MQAHKALLRTFTGGEPPETGCPWRAYEDIDVVAVLDLYSECRTDHGCTPALIQWDVPAPHWDGLMHYRQCVVRYRSKAREIEREAAERARLEATAIAAVKG